MLGSLVAVAVVLAGVAFLVFVAFVILGTPIDDGTTTFEIKSPIAYAPESPGAGVIRAIKDDPGTFGWTLETRDYHATVLDGPVVDDVSCFVVAVVTGVNTDITHLVQWGSASGPDGRCRRAGHGVNSLASELRGSRRVPSARSLS
jgi:hypothetical protein